ncbi:MAG TPA: hypothetical protein VK636_19520 [Gemmatimonadaceae bacterium]|nr:hypothetical protein [Gemmatimonadaceae bacterium]
MLTALALFPLLPLLPLLPLFPRNASAQVQVRPQSPTKSASDSMRMSDMADHAMSGPMDGNMMKHMEMTPPRRATHDDSVRATKIAAELKQAIAKYQDTAVAVADGYRMFLPNMKTQQVFHFTNNRRAFLAAFHFDASKPTSVLYKRGADGKLHLVGAMYTVGKNASLDRLNDRVPLSVAPWHKHVNWCLPKKGDAARWSEQKNGKPVFGPEGPLTTKAECDAINGDFHPTVFGWMLHANVFEGNDLASIFADVHGAPDHRAADRHGTP